MGASASSTQPGIRPTMAYRPQPDAQRQSSSSSSFSESGNRSLYWNFETYNDHLVMGAPDQQQHRYSSSGSLAGRPQAPTPTTTVTPTPTTRVTPTPISTSSRPTIAATTTAPALAALINSGRNISAQVPRQTPTTTVTPAPTTSRQQEAQEQETNPLPLSNNLASKKMNYCPFKKGDKVKVIAIGVNELKSLVNSEREWDPANVKCLNKTGTIIKSQDDCQVNVEFDDSKIVWTFDSETTVGHNVSDIVQLIDSETQVKKLQQGHGEFVPDMKYFLGKKGIICKVFSDGDLGVTFDGGTWVLNPKCVINTFRKPKSQLPSPKGRRKSPRKKKKTPVTSKIEPSAKSPFTIGDRVKVIAVKFDQLKELQEGHGGWNPRMVQTINKTGIVIALNESLDVTVLFNQTRFCWTFNPKALRKYYAGDIVKIISDKMTMKKILDENGKYSPKIISILGDCGVVMDTDNDGDLIVSCGENIWTLNPSWVINLSELAKSKTKIQTSKKKDEMTWRKWISQFLDDDSQSYQSFMSKFTRNKKPITFKSDTDSNVIYLLEKIRSLEDKLTQIEDENTCGICLENPKNIIFLCGHGVCSVCSVNLSVCHMCRKYLTYKISVY